ncbi:MAG: M20/M25/M40 family metallo-hydrolase [Candidatus Sedimenticola sp. (ex Thyasira tokunagai)]
MNEGSTVQRLKHHVHQLATVIGERNVYQPDALAAARHYIERTWQEQEYEVTSQEYTIGATSCANLEVTCHGTRQSDQTILVGAHYDTVPGSPGANDNGSGVASLLEISHWFRRQPAEINVRLVAFTNEESPFFMTARQGSRVYAQQVSRRGDDIRLMIALETMGYFSSEPGSQGYPPLFRYFYPDRADFIAFVSNFRSGRAMRHLANSFRCVSDFPLEHVATFSLIPGVAWSDHLSFWMQGYKALMVTDTAFYRYPWYHTAQDTAEKLDYEKLASVTEGLCEAISLLSSEGI